MTTDMAEFHPAHIQRWTMPDHYFGEVWPEYYSAGVGQSRHSGALERSNFRTMLQALGGESETVVVVREGHWAVGWIEWIAIHQDDIGALTTADRLMGKLEDYPILNEDDFYQEEYEEAQEVWSNCYSWMDRIEYIRKRRYQFEFHDWADMRSCIKGEYFNGDASELLY